MAEFKVGDKVRRIRADNVKVGAVLTVGTVCTVTRLTSEGGLIVDCFPWVSHPDFFELVEAAPSPATHVSSRSNDPATSKAAGKVKRVSLRQRVWLTVVGHPLTSGTVGWTGHELAEFLASPLNSVTPRLAELRREGKIKDSGQRRDKQIVWVLA